MPAQGITFNTTMALIAVAVPLLLLIFARVLQRRDRATIVGWSQMFGALGLFLFVTGTYMTLTWPLKNVPAASHCCAVDNISFGEPCMYFGALLLFGAFALMLAERTSQDHETPLDVVAVVRPFLYAGAFGGLAAVTAPFATEWRLVARIAAVSLFLAGMMWLFVALTVFYGHIGFVDVHP